MSIRHGRFSILSRITVLRLCSEKCANDAYQIAHRSCEALCRDHQYAIIFFKETKTPLFSAPNFADAAVTQRHKLGATPKFRLLFWFVTTNGSDL